MLEQMLGSIQSFVLNIWNVTYYSKRVPEELTVPSIYFMTSRSFDIPHSKEGFQNNYTLPINLFHHTTIEAITKAEEIAQAIRLNGNKIPLLNYEGEPTGDHLLVESVQVRDVDEGVALLNIAWTVVFKTN